MVTDPAQLATARAAVDAELAAIDLAASRFREDSEICAVNRAPDRAVRVSPLFSELLEVALAAAASTAGVVDPTLGGVLSALGYDRTFRTIEPTGPLPPVTVRQRPDWRLVQLDRAAGTVRLPVGVQLDLGATAKAYASDRAAIAASDATGCGVLLSLGGDIRVVGPGPEGGWAILVAEDSGAEVGGSGPVVSITSGGLATSSTTVRQWRRGDQVVHHLLDPLTGRPSTGPWRTVSVAAASCLEANVAATAAVVLGAGARAFLADRQLPARLVGTDGEALVVGGWPAELL